LAHNTISLNVKKLVTFFNWAISIKAVSGHPFKRIAEQRSQVVTIDEETFIGIVQRIKSPMLRDAVLVLWFTGLRIGELLSMKVQDFNTEKMLIYVPNHKAKREDVIPMVEQVRVLIDKYKNKNAESLLFVSSHDYLRREFRKAQDGTHYKIHDLRRSCATRLSRYVSPFTLQRYMRHSDIKITMMYYVRSDIELIRSEVATVPDFVTDLLPVSPKKA
jgi:integrase